MPKLNLPKKRTFIGDAPVWKRLLAFILDILIADFFILSAFDQVLVKLMDGSDLAGFIRSLQSDSGLYLGVIFLLGLITVLLVLYFSLMEYLIGQTPGKMLFNLRVVEKDTLALPKCWQCTVRSLYLIPVFPIILMWVVDPVYLLLKKERLSDLVSKTQVITVYQVV